jgi:hypothetical protein
VGVKHLSSFGGHVFENWVHEFMLPWSLRARRGRFLGERSSLTIRCHYSFL